jgi:intein/homing endonuclease
LSELKSSIDEIKQLLKAFKNESWRIAIRRCFKTFWIWKNFKRIGHLYKRWPNEKYLQVLCKTLYETTGIYILFEVW